MKTWFKRLHLSCALIAGLLLLSLATSASLLVFGKQLQQSLQPGYWQIKPLPENFDIHPAIADIRHKAALESRKIRQIRIASRPDWPWQVELADGEQWNYDPAEGRIIHHLRQGQDFYHWAMRWHRWLWMDEGAAHHWLRHSISAASLLLIIGLLLGYLMWLEQKKPLKRLRVMPLKTHYGRFYQYHLLAGVITGIPLVLIALTGISFNWSTQPLFEAATLSRIEALQAPRKVAVGGLEQLDKALDIAKDRLPNAAIRRIIFPANPHAPLQVRMQYPWEQAPFSHLWLDAGSGKVVAQHDSAQASRANRLWDFKYALHTGSWYGISSQLLWLLIAWCLLFMLVSGYYLYFKRLRASRRTPVRHGAGVRP